MTDAPEQIALRWELGAAVTNGPLMTHPEYTQYTRTDLVEALIAEAVAKKRERCAKECDRIAGNTKDFDRYTRRAAGMCAAAIRAGKVE